MQWKTTLAAILLLVCTVSGARDEPPEDIKIFGVTQSSDGSSLQMIEPHDFVVIASTSFSYVNKLTCQAENADQIEWEYVKEMPAQNNVEPSWNSTLPHTITVHDQTEVNGILSRQFDDNKRKSLRDAKFINGYYRCIVSNLYGYITVSPTVRIISPYLEGENAEPQKAPDFLGEPTENKPFRLPCFREASDNGGYRYFPSDISLYAPDSISKGWNLFANAFDSPLINDENRDRVKVDPVTGDLYYSYLKSTDRVVGTVSNTHLLRCVVYVGQDTNPRFTNQIIDFEVKSPTGDIPLVTIEYPKDLKKVNNKWVTETPINCISRQKCRVKCIFGGQQAVSGKIVGVAPNGQTIDGDSSGFTITPAEENENPVIYQCELVNKNNPTEKFSTIDIKVNVQSYPKLAANQDFPERRVIQGGTDVKFICNADFADQTRTKFYLNNRRIESGYPENVEVFETTDITLKKADRNNSGSYLCVSYSEIGELYSTSTLIVYDEAKLYQSPKVTTASPGYILEADGNNNASTYPYECNATLDRKADTARVVWYSNMKELNGQPITKGNSYGVKNVFTKRYEANSGKVESKLVLEYDTETQNYIRNTLWWCEIRYTIVGSDAPTPLKSVPALFDISAPPPSTPRPHTFPYPLVIGAVVGFIFFIALIILILCCVRKNTGEQYYVDEKERKAGHNPEEELEAYQFADYTRPDQNPVKGSRASMNFSDRPMESDTGSLDEYGDIDPGRYNEDGSFIGQYGQNGHQSRNQADV